MKLFILTCFLTACGGSVGEELIPPESLDIVAFEQCPTQGIYIVEYELQETECSGRFPSYDVDDVVINYEICGEYTTTEKRKWVAWDCFMDSAELVDVSQHDFNGTKTISLYCGDWGRSNGWPETCEVKYNVSGVFDRLNGV